MPHQSGSFDPERYRGYLLVVARDALRKYGRMQNKEDAEDVVQEALLRAHKHLVQFKGDSAAEFTAWISEILRNCLVDEVRYHHRDKRNVDWEESLVQTFNSSMSRIPHLIPSGKESPSGHAFRDERLVTILGALSDLPPMQQTAIEMRYVFGYSVAEIARELKCTSPAVAGMLRRGLDGLRSVLIDHSLE